MGCEELHSLQEWFSYDTKSKGIIIPKEQLIDIDHDDDDTTEYFDRHDWSLNTISEREVETVQLANRVTIHGIATLRERIIDVIQRYESVF